jgi:hypothetical protein
VIAADDHAVWMPADGGTKLAKIDPVHNIVGSRLTMPAGSFTAATGFGAVRVSSSLSWTPKTRQLVKVEPCP